MNLKKLTYDELIVRFGIIMEQVQVIKRGLKEHPNDEIFIKGLEFMIKEGKEAMNEIIKRKE